jgi:tetratricopeptide (TPR) repeat protein
MMSENRNLVWALGAIALVVLVGAFVLTLGGKPGGESGAPQSGLSSADAMKQGNDLYGQGKFAEAAQMYQQALKADSTNVSARVNLGNAYFALDRLDDAAREFTTASQASPNDADIHSNLGAVLLRQGKVADAQKEVEAAVRLKPALAEGHYILGVIYRQTGNNPLALAEFRQVITLTTDAKLKSEAEKQVAEINK